MKLEEENFDQLRRLLSIKRHEQPPPGFFNNFSQQVIARIEANADDSRATGLERLFREAPWVQRLWTAIEKQHALPGVFAALICTLVIFGIVYSEKTSYQPMDGQLWVDNTLNAPPPAEAVGDSSTNPVVQPVGSLFDQIQADAVQPASFDPGGN
jgi:hypothetical protein